MKVPLPDGVTIDDLEVTLKTLLAIEYLYRLYIPRGEVHKSGTFLKGFDYLKDLIKELIELALKSKSISSHWDLP